MIIIPYSRHIELRKIAYADQDFYSWKTGQVTYKIREINEIMIIVFIFPDKRSNFLIHLNYPWLKQTGGAAWLCSENLAFMIMLLDPVNTKIIVGLQMIRLTKEDTDQIRECCLKQGESSMDTIDARIKFIYNLEVEQALVL